MSSWVENCYWSMLFSRRVNVNICVLLFDWLMDGSWVCYLLFDWLMEIVGESCLYLGCYTRVSSDLIQKHALLTFVLDIHQTSPSTSTERHGRPFSSVSTRSKFKKQYFDKKPNIFCRTLHHGLGSCKSIYTSMKFGATDGKGLICFLKSHFWSCFCVIVTLL